MIVMMAMVMMTVMMEGLPLLVFLLSCSDSSLRVLSLCLFELRPTHSLRLLRQASRKQHGCCDPIETPYQPEHRVVEVLLAGHALYSRESQICPG